MNPDLTDARLREIESEDWSKILVFPNEVRIIASALLRTREERDAAVALLKHVQEALFWAVEHLPDRPDTMAAVVKLSLTIAEISQHPKGGDATSHRSSQPSNPAKCSAAPEASVSGATDHNPDVRKMVLSTSDTETRHG